MVASLPSSPNWSLMELGRISLVLAVPDPVTGIEPKTIFQVSLIQRHLRPLPAQIPGIADLSSAFQKRPAISFRTPVLLGCESYERASVSSTRERRAITSLAFLTLAGNDGGLPELTGPLTVAMILLNIAAFGALWTYVCTFPPLGQRWVCDTEIQLSKHRSVGHHALSISRFLPVNQPATILSPFSHLGNPCQYC